MSLKCPNCNKPLPWYRITGKFSCPSCEARLTATKIAPGLVVIVIVLWSFIELIMRELTTGLGFVGQILIIFPSLLVGLLLYRSIYLKNVTVRRAEKSDSQDEENDGKKRKKKDT